MNATGAADEVHGDLVNDYMSLWDIKTMLIEDINERGAVVVYTSNTGQENVKKNESIGELLKVNAQMLKILEHLKVSLAESNIGIDDDL